MVITFAERTSLVERLWYEPLNSNATVEVGGGKLVGDNFERISGDASAFATGAGAVYLHYSR